MSSSENLKIPLQEILLVTNEFAKENFIAKGGFGNVYLGRSKQHGLLAIKRLDRVHGQGDREFGMEVRLLTTYKHEHLVSLVGFCEEACEKILVYKYEKNGSLDNFLADRKHLTWQRRLQICLDAARGLRYLHHEMGSEVGVIHRDIKSSNILLNENWKAKISDFGLSKVAVKNAQFSVIYSEPCGTHGYLDPEYENGALTQKSDVYSFGVVLFEVLFGKSVSIPRLLKQHNFSVEMAKNHYQEKTLDKMINPDLRNQMNSASLSTFSDIAHQCLKNRRVDRPTMRLVVEELEKALSYQQQASSEFSHDVYISFRDQDAARYVDGICDVLESEGFSTYKDNIKSSRKESVLLAAIKRSRSFIIIFSKKFAANSWNLDEVAKIVECVKERRKVVIPVYYDVYCTDVRSQRGYFGEAMSKYDTHPMMGAWRNALIEATNVPGLEDSDFRSSKDLAKEAAARIKGQLLGKR